MPTTVTYGNVTLRNVQTRSWDEELVYDPVAQAEVMYMKYRLVFESIVHLADLPSLWPTKTYPSAYVLPTAAGSAAELLDEVRRDLERPREKLVVKFGTHKALEIDPHDFKNHFDVDHGPKPTLLRITQVSGSAVWRILWVVEAARVVCPEAGQRPKTVIIHKWALAETMDADFYVTTSLHGYARFLHHEINPQDFRHLILPPLEESFRREHYQFDVAADGLSVNYTVVDRQTHTAAPFPATTITGSHTSTVVDGLSFLQECHVRLSGPVSALKSDLLARAAQVLESRLGLWLLRVKSKSKKAWPYIIESATLTNYFGQANMVDASMRIRVTPGDEASEYLKFVTGRLGATLVLPSMPIEYRHDRSSEPAPYGYYHTAERTAAALLARRIVTAEHPCDEPESPGHVTLSTQGGKFGDGSSGGSGNLFAVSDSIPGGGRSGQFAAAAGQAATLTVRKVAQAMPPGEIVYDDEVLQTIYTTYRLTTTYQTRPVTVALPIASRSYLAAPSGRSRAARQAAQQAARSESEAVARAAQQPGGKRNLSRDTAALIELGGAVCRKIVVYEAERVGDWPAVPPADYATVSGDVVEVLADHTIEVQSARPTNDGNQLMYYLTGRQTYHLSRPPDASERIELPRLPHVAARLTPEQSGVALGKIEDDALMRRS